MDADQHDHGDRSEGHPQSSEDWDARYAESELIWSGEPNGALVAEVAELSPGRALDVGCGEGADAVWLAQRGWDVTAIDVSSVALGRAQVAAERVGADVRWVLAGLLDAVLPDGGFDLVSAQYAVLLKTPDDVAEHTLIRAVGPGGVLLVVHHADIDRDGALERGWDPDDYAMPRDIAALLGDGWHLTLDERRDRSISGGGGAQHHHDVVLRAVRTG